jgi:hypothetical protein
VRRRGQGAAIDVINEEYRRQQENDRAAGSPRRVNGRWGARVQLA